MHDHSTIFLFLGIVRAALPWLSQLLRSLIMTKAAEFLTVGQVAAKIGLRPQQVARLYERGELPPAQRVGVRRIIPVEDVPKVEAAARKVGYLK